MNTFPGFNANASLYKSFGYYALPVYTVCGPCDEHCQRTCYKSPVPVYIPLLGSLGFLKNCCSGIEKFCQVGQPGQAGTCVCLDPKLKNCSGTCTDLTSDSKNCGSCGTICPDGVMCQGGNCVCNTCPGTNTCVDTQKDPNHCGSCGTVCNSGSFCCHGQCAVDGSVCCDDPPLPYDEEHVCCPPGLHKAACPTVSPVCCPAACCLKGDGCKGNGTCCKLGESGCLDPDENGGD
jgi:hypothetical protein